MPYALKSRVRTLLEVAIALTPWLISMYTLYWLEHGDIWTTATPHRGKITVTILLLGMALTFLILSYFAARQKS